MNRVITIISVLAIMFGNRATAQTDTAIVRADFTYSISTALTVSFSSPTDFQQVDSFTGIMVMVLMSILTISDTHPYTPMLKKEPIMSA